MRAGGRASSKTRFIAMAGCTARPTRSFCSAAISTASTAPRLRKDRRRSLDAVGRFGPRLKSVRAGKWSSAARLRPLRRSRRRSLRAPLSCLVAASVGSLPRHALLRIGPRPRVSLARRPAQGFILRSAQPRDFGCIGLRHGIVPDAVRLTFGGFRRWLRMSSGDGKLSFGSTLGSGRRLQSAAAIGP